MKTIDMGNNETRGIGVVATPDGFIALTLSQSKTFKTERGAVAWIERRGYTASGERLAK
jgi:hypothetical protein